MKYLVLKEDDIKQNGSVRQTVELNALIRAINAARAAHGKNTDNTYLVINTDEPYAGEIADTIELHERLKGTWDHGEKSLREVMGISGEKQTDLTSQLALAQADNAVLTEAYMATESVKGFMTMPPSYINGDWSDEKEARYDEAKKRYAKAVEVFSNSHPGASLLAELEQLREERTELLFIKDVYTYLLEALKEMPGILPDILNKINSAEFKDRFTKGSDLADGDAADTCRYCDDEFVFWQAEIGGNLPNVKYCPMCRRSLKKGGPVE